MILPQTFEKKQPRARHDHHVGEIKHRKKSAKIKIINHITEAEAVDQIRRRADKNKSHAPDQQIIMFLKAQEKKIKNNDQDQNNQGINNKTAGRQTQSDASVGVKIDF